jgi:alkylation response protein AidB-like acyl-CoA dehydrogenase
MALDQDTRGMMLETAGRLLADNCPPDVINAAEKGVWPSALWDALEEAGLTVIAAAEEAGGVGGSLVDLAAVQRLLGYYAVPLPAAETALARHLGALAKLDLPSGPLGLAIDQTSLRVSADGKRVSGVVRNLPWSQAAKAIVAVAEGEGGVKLVLAGAPGKADVNNSAGEPRGRLALQDTALTASAALPHSAAEVWQLAALMRVQQMAGAGQRILDICTQYARDRKQFGKPIGSFQAVQQLLSELAGHVAAVNAAAESAAGAADQGQGGFAIAAAKARGSESAGKIAASGHQVLGAMGFTYEHNLHHFTRRLWCWRDEYGSDTYWAAELGRLVCGAGPDALWPSLTAGQIV